MRNIRFYSIPWAFLLLMFTGCTPAPVESIRIGTNIWPGYEPLYLARSLGWLDEPNVKMVEFTSAASVLQAMRDRRLEMAAVTLDEALLLQQDVADIRVVLIMDESHGADALLAHPDIESLEELRGKRIGVETTALGAYMFARILDHAQLEEHEVTLVRLPQNELFSRYQQGSVDAVVTFDPVKSRLLKLGANVLFDSSQIAGEIVDVLVVHTDILKHQRPRLNKVVHAWFRALRYLKEHPQDAARRMQPRIKLPVQDLLSQYDGLKLLDLNANKKMLEGGLNSTLSININKMMGTMLSRKLIRKTATEIIVDDSLLQANGMER